MNALRYGSIAALLGLLAVASGCAGTPAQTDEGAAPAAPSTGSAAAASASSRPSAGTIYFNYRESSLDRTDKAVLDGWAAYLKANASAKVSLEGHCDERGSVELNLALGQKRAKSAQDYLESAGVPAGQLSTTSHGKSRPVASGSNEEAWAQNRRVELVLR